eukprot:6180119-Pleurochrysis_carterae.AAC.1
MHPMRRLGRRFSSPLVVRPPMPERRCAPAARPSSLRSMSLPLRVGIIRRPVVKQHQQIMIFKFNFDFAAAHAALSTSGDKTLVKRICGERLYND